MDAPANTIASPCVRNCCLDHGDICLGCFRSLDEILAWGGSDRVGRIAILEAAGHRADASGAVARRDGIAPRRLASN